MKKSWLDRLLPGRSDWIERAAREGLDAYAREHDGIPRVPDREDAAGDRTPSFA